MRFILLAITDGDGDGPRGDRLFAQEFHTRSAAEGAAHFLRDCAETIIIDDFPPTIAPANSIIA